MRRYATLASVSKSPEWGIGTDDGRSRLLNDAAAFVRRAARMGADIVAFPEVYPQLRTDPMVSFAEPEEAGTIVDVGAMAREHGVYVIWPRFEKSADGRLHNSSVLLGRDGAVVGRYHKMFPTIGEMEDGIEPGTDAPVFETDFGRVGMAICFDLNYPEVRHALTPSRPDVVFFSSMYRGGIQCQQWALELGCHFVSAIAAELGRIVDPGGRVLQLSTYEGLVVQRVNLNCRQLHMDYNWDKIDAMLERYGSAVTFQMHTQEARFVVGYEREDRDVDEILAEFGLEHLPDYFARARRERLARAPRERSERRPDG